MKVLLTVRRGLKVSGLSVKAKKIARAIFKLLDLKKEVEVSLLITGDEEIRELNSKFRGFDKPTDVLSFPMDDPTLLGDIVISAERTKEQSLSYDVSFYEELSRLLVHGTLHLLGYDHVKGGTEAGKMRRKEASLMESLRELGLFSVE